MFKLDKLINGIFSPPRVTYKSFLYQEKKYLKSFNHFELGIITGEDTALDCNYFQNKESSDVTVVYVHSYASCQYEGCLLLETCIKNKYNLFIYDQRGCGESFNGQFTFGQQERIDLLYVILKLEIEFSVSKFIFWGRSFGCTVILQLYQSLISKEGRQLNRINEQRYLKKQKKAEKLNLQNVIKKQKYPKNFNLLIQRNLVNFLKLNKINLGKNFVDVKFQILGIVLDSPYTSIDDIIEDNMKKFLPYLPHVFIYPVQRFFKAQIYKKIQVNLDLRKNTDIIKYINLNTVLIISKKDELIPIKRFLQLKKNYAEKFKNKNKLSVLDSNQSHRLQRSKQLVDACINRLKNNTNKTSVYEFFHSQNISKQQSQFLNQNTLIDMPDLDPKQKFSEFSSKQQKVILSKILQLDVNNIIDKIQGKVEQENTKVYIEKQKIQKNKIKKSQSASIFSHKTFLKKYTDIDQITIIDIHQLSIMKQKKQNLFDKSTEQSNSQISSKNQENISQNFESNYVIKQN